jgi:pimeloyl-ACP methyl ester carboxylesterase
MAMRHLLPCLAALLVLGAAQAQTPSPWWQQYRDGARLVTLPDGRKLSLYCEGQGTPVVMLESGIGPGAWSWRKVQDAIAQTTKSCSYDRAGYWNSPATDGPRDAGAEADDLAALLKAANLPAPYVIVGHSYGGMIARLYAGRHTADLAGLVLVDPSSAHQSQAAASVLPAMAAFDAATIAKARACSAAQAKDCVLTPPPKDLPPALLGWFTAAETPGYAGAMARELEAMPALSSDQLDAEKKNLGTVPFLLLNEDWGKLAPPGTPAAQSEALSAVWLKMHRDIMDISGNSELRIISGAGHQIQLDRPEAVIQAVTQVVAEARLRR